MNALWKLEYNGQDITARLSDYFISLSLTDSRGITSDSLSFTLIDTDGRLELPPIGSMIRLWLGDQNTGLIFKGAFVIDELESSGPPDIISIKTNAADFTKGLKVKRDDYYEYTTLGKIVEAIAARHSLTPAISDSLKNIEILHITQTNESDLNLISRLAKDYGGFSDIKNQTLIFSEEAISQTTSGQQIPEFTLARSETSQYRFTEKTRKNKFTGARAAWHDFTQSKKVWEVVGDEEKLKSLSPYFPNPEKARAAAKAEFDRLKRGALTMSVNLSQPAPALIPETPIQASGFKPIINDANWVIISVTHNLGAEGLRTDIELETQLSV